MEAVAVMDDSAVFRVPASSPRCGGSFREGPCQDFTDQIDQGGDRSCVSTQDAAPKTGCGFPGLLDRQLLCFLPCSDFSVLDGSCQLVLTARRFPHPLHLVRPSLGQDGGLDDAAGAITPRVSRMQGPRKSIRPTYLPTYLDE